MNADKKNSKNKFFSGVALLALSTFIVKIIGMFYKIPMMAYLGAEGMGYFNSAYEIYSLFFVIATTGIPVAISILISENRSQGRIKNIKKIFFVSVVLLGAIGFLGTLLMAIFHNELAIIISNNAASLCILAISPTLLMICISSAIRGYFQGQQIMIPTAISQIIESLGKLILGLTFAIIALNKGYAISTVAVFAIIGLTLSEAISLLFLIVFKLFSKNTTDTLINEKTETNKQIAKNILSIAIPITISSVILNINKLIDMTMILSRLFAIGYTQEQANAIYGAYSTMAVSIFNLPATFVSAIAVPLVPALTYEIENRNQSKIRSVISSAYKLCALITFPAGLGISIFSKPILHLLFSSQANDIEYTAPLLSLLGISVFLSSMITVTNAVLQSYKQVKKPIISMVIGTAVKLFFSYVLIGIPSVNVYGAPISTFFSTLIIVAFNLFFIARNLPQTDKLYNVFLKPFIAALLSVTAGIPIFALLAHYTDSRIIILVTIAAVMLIYMLAVIKIKAINKNEILMIPQGEKILNILIKLHII